MYYYLMHMPYYSLIYVVEVHKDRSLKGPVLKAMHKPCPSQRLVLELEKAHDLGLAVLTWDIAMHPLSDKKAY